jgi:hypothetical protein
MSQLVDAQLPCNTASPRECKMELMACAHYRAVSAVAQELCVENKTAPIQDAAMVSATPTVTATRLLIVTSHFLVVQDIELILKILVHGQ